LVVISAARCKLARKRQNEILGLLKDFGDLTANDIMDKLEGGGSLRTVQLELSKLKKRDFRKLWIARINAATRMNGLSYSRFMNGMKLAGIDINRKMLSEIAINDPKAFAELVEVAKKQLQA